MKPLVATLEEQLIASFRELAKSICSQFSNVSAEVHSHSVGALTENQGHLIGIDCLLLDAPDDQPDNVALSVDLQHLTTIPKVDADVCWGHPSGYIEAEFSSESLEVSDEVLRDLYSQLPRLCKSLIEAIGRRKPSNWDEAQA